MPVQRDSISLGPKTIVELRETMTGEIFICHDDKVIATQIVEKPGRKRSVVDSDISGNGMKKPAVGHPWYAKRRKHAGSKYEDYLWQSLNTNS